MAGMHRGIEDMDGWGWEFPTNLRRFALRALLRIVLRLPARLSVFPFVPALETRVVVEFVHTVLSQTAGF
jgi:hypothetical protein